jgi:hypothetical protein
MMTRIARASGIASSILIVIGIFLLVIEEIDTRTDQEIVSYYNDSGNRAAEDLGLALVGIGALLFLWFLSALRTRLRAAEPEPRVLSTLAFGAGIAAAALLVGAGALLDATTTAIENDSDFVVDPNLARFAVSTGFLFLLGWMIVNCVLVLATSTLALRTNVLPTWFAWVGYAAVPLAIAESFLLPVFVIPAWILIASVILTTQSEAVEQRATA